MNKKRKNVFLLVFLLALLLMLNYSFLDKKIEDFLQVHETATIDRVIDGDTVEINGTSFRLIGINSPERGEKYYEEAKVFLENLILNETVTLEYVGSRQDKYYRGLAYLHFEDENINVKMVENGFANYYFYDSKDKYSNSLEEAWDSCLDNNINLCERSSSICKECLILNEDSLVNSCDFACDLEGWEVKTEGRDKITFSEILSPGEIEMFELDLSNSGRTLFLRDKSGKLVSWNVF